LKTITLVNFKIIISCKLALYWICVVRGTSVITRLANSWKNFY